jgi:MSHA biogenesis protein MshM
VYLKHFGLKTKPFLVTPETEAFFTGGSRHSFWESLVYVLKTEEGIFKVVGEVGSGKTTVCRYLLKKLPSKRFKTIYFADPTLTREQMLYALADGLDLPLDRAAPELMIVMLQKKLAEIYSSDRKVVLLIDEAHAMPEETLDQIRLLSQVEASGNKIMQIVLFGPEELDHNLALPELRPVRERITQSFRLKRLNLKDISEYLDFKMKAAGYEGPTVFSQNAIRLMVRLTNGVPRRINILADKALLSAGLGGRFTVNSKDILTAAREIKLEKTRTSADTWLIGFGSFFAGSAISIAVLSLALSKGWVHIDSPFDRPQESARTEAESSSVAPLPLPALAPSMAKPGTEASAHANTGDSGNGNSAKPIVIQKPRFDATPVDPQSILSGVMEQQTFGTPTSGENDRTSGDGKR